jgi:hypothetical protein
MTELGAFDLPLAKSQRADLKWPSTMWLLQAQWETIDMMLGE